MLRRHWLKDQADMKQKLFDEIAEESYKYGLYKDARDLIWRSPKKKNSAMWAMDHMVKDKVNTILASKIPVHEEL